MGYGLMVAFATPVHMILVSSSHLLVHNTSKPRFQRKPTVYNRKPSKHCFTSIPSSLSSNPNPLKLTNFHSGISSGSSNAPSITSFFSPEKLLLFLYLLIFLCLRLLASLLPPDFPQRWHDLIVFSEKAEAEAKSYPSHLFQAVVAYEDRRFFFHCGVDPVGIARAVVFFPKGGGGSTITQQLVKNVFLSNDRTFLRKAIEMFLAVILEQRLSKPKILSSYLSKIYWGHGIYGIEAASNFYFGKHPILLSLGESAMLVGIIPAPELRSPFNEPSRGKSSQARVLRRMVDNGFLDIEVALSAMHQCLHLHGDGKEHPDRLLYSLKEESRDSVKGESNALNNIWDWERESKIWEIREGMERWAISVDEKKNSKRTVQTH